jgi:hypothetical protein
MLYGWLLEPELFGPGNITLRFDDGSATNFKRPTTATEAYDTFELVAIFWPAGNGWHEHRIADR